MKNDAKIATSFNSFFKNVVNTLNIKEDERILCEAGNETYPVKIAIKKYIKQQSILRIKQLIENPMEFYFVSIDEDLTTKEIQNLDLKKDVPNDG